MKSINVLIAEDNAADRMLIKEILLDTGIPAHIDEVADGAVFGPNGLGPLLERVIAHLP